ncbi:MAG: XTP/dITP diphosphatase [Chloroflexi bacterium]|nr:XTP/dITP diphosphatase [Chloroflexota bacterium]MBI3040852.1 XTP/dITP diphosphatase [Chloroflexota bacterium]MBI3931297.1 XTP/dITP diphosphatase [Chloroflexota bacterium]
MGDKLLLATNNQGKVREYKSLFKNIPLELVTLAEQGITTVVDEVGASLEENARLKATLLAAESQLLALADDSGLEVAALNGEPGRLSARYAGEGASDRDRVSYLLSRLRDVPWEQRSACFRCVIAVATPNGEVALCCGECRGFIAFAPRGEQGFGYDPVFYLPDLDKTMAELPLEIKNQVSHRGQAARKVYQVLKQPPFSAFS